MPEATPEKISQRDVKRELCPQQKKQSGMTAAPQANRQKVEHLLARNFGSL